MFVALRPVVDLRLLRYVLVVPHLDCSRVRLHAWGGVSARYLVNRYFCGEGTEGRFWGDLLSVIGP